MSRAMLATVILGTSLAAMTSMGYARTTAPVQAAVTEAPAEGVQFFWFVDQGGQRKAVQPPHGDLDLGLEGWSCGYEVDPIENVDAKLSQFGSLACENPQAGKVIDTLVLCQTSESRRTDHGGGSLTAVVGDRWPGTLLAMSCSTENPPKERPTVQLPANPGAPTPVGGGLGRRIRPEDAADEASPEAADSTEVETPTAPLRFVWRLEVTDPGRHSDAVVLDPRHDTIEHGLDGWSCSYAIHDVPSSTGAPAEAGSLVCDSGEGVTFATAVVCTPTPDSPNVCQAGSLRFGAGEDGIRALMLTCKDTANPGCF